MLGDDRIHPTIPFADPARSRRFYEQTLGTQVIHADDAGLIVRAGPSFARLYRSPGAGSSQATVAAFTVRDLEQTMAELRGRGIRFEEYDLPHLKTNEGIAEVGGERAAWFRDSEGNILALVEGPLPGVDQSAR